MKALAVMLMCLSAAGAAFAQDDEKPIVCGSCEAWNKPHAPFNIYGNTWYVGTADLSALLVASPQGHILLDGALPQSAQQIRKNIETLGFKIKDVKLILNSHAHWDHAGGIAALARMSGATVAASASSARTMQAGTNLEDDPQYDPKDVLHYPKVRNVKVIADGETVTVGPLKLTAHLTPGHTTGSTAWTWNSCESGQCRNIVYADSLTAVSHDDFHYSGDARHPDISASFRASMDKVANLPCDVIVSTHPGFTNTLGKLAARTPTSNPFVEVGGCKAYAEAAVRNFEKRLERERNEKAGKAAR